VREEEGREGRKRVRGEVNEGARGSREGGGDGRGITGEICRELRSSSSFKERVSRQVNGGLTRSGKNQDRGTKESPEKGNSRPPHQTEGVCKEKKRWCLWRNP